MTFENQSGTSGQAATKARESASVHSGLDRDEFAPCISHTRSKHICNSPGEAPLPNSQAFGSRLPRRWDNGTKCAERVQTTRPRHDIAIAQCQRETRCRSHGSSEACGKVSGLSLVEDRDTNRL